MGYMHDLLFICISGSEIFGITQLRVSVILFAGRQLSVMLPFYFSIDIVLMLAHVFGAFVELEYVNHFLFCLFFKKMR